MDASSQRIIVRCGNCRLEMTVSRKEHRRRCPKCYRDIPIIITPSSTVTTTDHRSSKREMYASNRQPRSFVSSNPKGGLSVTHRSVDDHKQQLVRQPSNPVSGYFGGGRKKAVICGVTYSKKYELKGPLNDAYKMKDFLQNRCGFPDQSIYMLVEDGQAERMPTKYNIERCLKWLVKGCKAGDSLVFYFSGHGLNQPDRNNDELDMFDETLCPVDFLTKGLIFDDDLNSVLVRPLPTGVTLHAIVDSCHSGTILDLPWVFNLDRGCWKDNRAPSGEYKGTNGGLAVSFSACRDDQIAADTTAFSKKGMSGAMTHCFIQTVEKFNFDLTYYQLLNTMDHTLKDSYASRCFAAHWIDRLRHRDFTQDPLLSSSEMFDVYHTKFRL